ncbi:interleukin-31 receptor subunit alpha isoform X2 [Pseudonaja textilis]|uniref:interleukin-31 receptor subunit alpha isoform X2 n=1 Tax=Pseudonaja textilis TaxID=8673 RepID=UPI000EA867B7|nr:interleukin-31 receptor subunit alpha isoform X2 [Pseudonaja textilis]
MSSLCKMSQIKAFLSLLWNLTILCIFCLTASPQKPEIISCIYYYSDILNCSWTSGRELPSGTNCWVVTTENNGKSQTNNGTMENGSCIANYILSGSVVKQVKVGELVGETFNLPSQRMIDILKPSPPEILKVEGMKEMLRVDLRRNQHEPSYDRFLCQIRYEATTKNISKCINIQIKIIETTKSLNLTGLWNFTNYTVAVRCKGDGFGKWSEWSNRVTNRTEEQAPLKIDLWRVIETYPNGNRSVHLLWKEYKEFPSSGIITGCKVKYNAEHINTTFEKKYNHNEPIILSLTKDAYNIRFTAYNSAGYSPEVTIRIPSKHEETIDQKQITHLKASALEEKVRLTWDSTNSEINDYIIEWHDELEKDPNKRSWDKITNTTEWISQKGIFKHFKCYNFSVYPLYKEEIKKPTSISIYFHESVPSTGPQAETENAGKDYAIITWKEIPKAERNGVIINYTIIYKEGNKSLEETVDSSILKYKLKSLQPNTHYRAWIKANTIMGGTKGNEINFFTKLLSTTDIILATVFIGIFMICILSFGLLWALKYKMIKRICWPQIPHPVIASYPAVSQKIILGNSSSKDDINILKMDTCRENELPFLNPENFFEQANATAKITVAGQETFCTGEYRALECLLPVSSLNHDFKNQTFLTMKSDSESSANDEMQYQEYFQEKTEFSSYLKNSVCSREFLNCENVEQNTKEPETQPASLASYSAEDPYVAPDTDKLLSKY